ncbi:MAG: hypothetical protein ACEPOZ_14505 [Marinifilaceae bacterium]|jgi:hypothetical protein
MLILLLCIWFVPSQGTVAKYKQTEGQQEQILFTPNLFESDSLLELTIHTNLKELVRDVGDKRSYHPGRLSYYLGDSIVTQTIELKTRGHFRKDRSICNFPPIRIRFNRAESTFTLFHNQHKLKMVTHCQNRIKNYEQMVIQEYLIYKAYNLFTPESFRVRLARITYKDSKGSMKPLTKFAFFLEDADKMAYRNHKVIVDREKVHQDATPISKITRLAVFQYMVGNTDWGVPTLHNIKLMASGPQAQPVAVPYDFDWASLVNAPYAVPNVKLNIKSIHDRLYRGYAKTPEEMEYIFREFRMLKDELYELYTNSPYLNDANKKRVLDYFDEFYYIINNPKLVKREFIDNAREYKFKEK